MARFSAFFVIATAAAHVLAVPGRAQDAEAIEAQIRAAWEETHSITAALAMDATVIELPFTGVGEARVLKVDGKTYYDQFIHLEFPPPMGVNGTVQTLYDGAYLYVVNEMLGEAEAFRTQPAISGAPPPPDAAMLLDAVKAHYSLAAAEGDAMDAREALWLEGLRRSPAERVERIRIGFDRETGFPLHIELHSPDAPEPVVLRHTALRVNPGLEASAFVFQAPEGVEIQIVDTPAPTDADDSIEPGGTPGEAAPEEGGDDNGVDEVNNEDEDEDEVDDEDTPDEQEDE